MKLRILHVTPDLVPYGLENMIAGLVRTLSGERFGCGVVSLYAESAGGLEPDLRRIGVPVFHLNKRRGMDVRMYPRLRRAIREFRPHVLHTHNYVLRYAYPLARMEGVPVVHTIHNLAEHEVDRLGMALQRVAFRRGVAPVTIAGEVSASFHRTYGFAEAAMIPNGIDVAKYAAPKVGRTAWRAAEGIPENDFVYLCVARFAPQKDHENLLRAFAQGPAKIPGTRLALAGDGELRGAIEAHVRELQLTDRVQFLGRRNDMAEALGACDVFALGSRWEGNPLSVMEAMAAARPVAATAVGAIPELVRHGVDGLLAPAGDATALGRALRTMFELRKSTLPSMGLTAALRARDRFGLEAMSRSYGELYARVCGDDAGSREAAPVLMRSTS